MNRTELVPAAVVWVDADGWQQVRYTTSPPVMLSTVAEAADELRKGKATLVAGDRDTLWALWAELGREVTA